MRRLDRDHLFDTPAGFDDPLEMLLGCHRRIERQLETLKRLRAHVAAKGVDAEASIAAKKDNRALQLTPAETRRLQAAFAYVERNRGRRWMKELAPWRAAMLKLISGL